MSLFVLPLIAGVGIYLLILIVLPSLNQILALLIALIVAWTVRYMLRRLESVLADRKLQP